MIRLVTFGLLVAALAGCVTDDGSDDGRQSIAPESLDIRGSHPAYGFPISAGLSETPTEGLPEDWVLTPGRAIPQDIVSLEHLAGPAGPDSGAGIAIFGHYAYAGAWNTDDFAVVDIMDPTNPQVLGTVPVRTGDADVIAYPDGRLIVVTATRGQIIEVIDVTDPSSPEHIFSIETTTSNHNLAVVPGTPIVYNAGGSVDIWDLSDPEDPVNVQVFTDGGEDGRCHDIEFHIDREAELYRGICAGYGNTELWDITDPLDPSVVNKFPYPSLEQGLPLVPKGVIPDQGVQGAGFSHLAIVNHDYNVLIVGDETGGGAAPACDIYVAGESGPIGNLWFYDITDEMNPVLVDHLSVSITDAYGSCTAHFGRVIGETNHLVMAYYTAGLILVDFTEPNNAFIKDQYRPKQPTNGDLPCTLCGTWDGWFHQGYLFTGDIDRGMDILTLG